MDKQTERGQKGIIPNIDEISATSKGYGAPFCSYCKDSIAREAEFVPDDFGVLLPMHPRCAPEYEEEQYWRNMPAEEKTQLLESARRKVRICELAAENFCDQRPKEYVSFVRTAALLTYAVSPFLWMIPFYQSDKDKFKNDKEGAACLLTFSAMIDAAFTILPMLPYYTNPDPDKIIPACSAPIIVALAKAVGVYFLKREQIGNSVLIKKGLDKAVELMKEDRDTLEQKIQNSTP